MRKGLDQKEKRCRTKQYTRNSRRSWRSPGGNPKWFRASWKLLDEAEAKLVLAAALLVTVEELSAKTGIDAAKIEAMIDPLFRKGILFKSSKNRTAYGTTACGRPCTSA